MRNLFDMFYVPESTDFERLWKECIFVFDANILLNLYRYSIKTTDIFLDIINKFSSRIWIPHQVALEYQANRMGVIYEQVDAYHNVRQIINKASTDLFAKLDEELKNYKRRHPIIEVGAITSRIDGYLKLIYEELENQEKSHPNYIVKDTIRELLEEKLTGKIGGPYDESKLKLIFEEGEKRYKQKRPPGYKDAVDKKGEYKYYRGLVIESQYGDLIVWKQIMDMAKSEEKSIIFVTDDAKDDWWKREHGKTIGPRSELIDEFIYNTGQNFYMYESYRFIEYAQTFMKQQIDVEAIKEVQELKESKKKDLRERMEKIAEMLKINPSSFSEYDTISPKESITYNAGDAVLHPKWGLGFIESTKDEGDEQEIKVLFPEPISYKRLLSKFAPIKKVINLQDN
jgi:hypothetical protein